MTRTRSLNDADKGIFERKWHRTDRSNPNPRSGENGLKMGNFGIGSIEYHMQPVALIRVF
jgi:hypothetical protein